MDAIQEPPKAYDLFISYAGEDRNFVSELASALRDRGLHVWYDRFCLKLGDSIAGGIDEGLAGSRFGVVVVSPDFFRTDKEWTRKELGALLQRRGNVLLPAFHRITPEGVREHSPLLADKFGVSTSEGLERVVELLVERIRPELHGARGLALETLGRLAKVGEDGISEALGLGQLTNEELLDELERARKVMRAVRAASEHIARADSPNEVMRLLRDVQRRVITIAGGPYCFGCRTRVEMMNPQAVTMKNGKPAVKGWCPICGTPMFRVFKAE